MGFRQALIVAPVFALVTACASSSAEPSSSTTEGRISGRGAAESTLIQVESAVESHFVGAPAERVWQVLPAVYRLFEIPVNQIDESHRVLGNTAHRTSRIDGKRMSLFLDCGSGMTGAIADTYAVTLKLVTSVVAGSETSSQIHTEVDATARARDTNSGVLHCVSTGELEQLFVATVRELLGIGASGGS